MLVAVPTFFWGCSPGLLYFLGPLPPRRVSFNLVSGALSLSSLCWEGHNSYDLPSALILFQLKNVLGTTLYFWSFS